MLNQTLDANIYTPRQSLGLSLIALNVTIQVATTNSPKLMGMVQPQLSFTNFPSP